MQFSQDAFFKELKGVIPQSNSIIDMVSTILDISYDAAYRRVNNKASLSLDEAVKLAKYYKISLNKLFETGNGQTLLVEKSTAINTLKDLEHYFLSSQENVAPLVKLKSASIVYSAKDIPIFYTLTDNLLLRYKFYIWLKFLNGDGTFSKMNFREFLKMIPQSLIDSACKLGEIYSSIAITEFWNDNTINGTLQQINYYYGSGLINKEDALELCENVSAIVDRVEVQTIAQVISKSNSNASYLIYKSDLLTMSNVVLIKTRDKKVFFTPFTVLTYLKVEHQETCEEMDMFFNKQMKNSKLLVNAGEKDRMVFYNKMRAKIETLKNFIALQTDYFNF